MRSSSTRPAAYKSRVVFVAALALTGCLSTSASYELIDFSGIDDDSLNSVAVSPDGNLFAVGSGKIRVYETESGKLLRILNSFEGPTYAIAFAKQTGLIATGGWDEHVHVWDVTTGERIGLLSGHSSCISSLTFSPDGERLASGSFDSTVRIWDVHERKCSFVLKENEGGVRAIAWSPDGRWIASDDGRCKVVIYDVSKQEELTALVGHDLAVHFVAFSPDGSILATGASDKQVILWDTASWKQIKAFHTAKIAYALTFIDGGRRLVTGGGEPHEILDESGNIQVWDMANCSLIETHSCHSKWVRGLAASRDSSLLVSVSYDGTMARWKRVGQ